MSILEFSGLVAGYGDAPVLRHIDLAVGSDDAVAIIGRNGAGKTSLLQSVYGGTRIMSGSIKIDGRDINPRKTFLPASLGVALAPQGKQILPNLSVRENLQLGAASGRRGAWSLEKVYELFPILGERAAKPGTALSGGQQQMLAIGRALMANPRVLLLDEPSEGLAPVLIDQVVDALTTIRESGTALVVVEQHLPLIRRVADRFHVMKKGQIVESGALGDSDLSSLRDLLAL